MNNLSWDASATLVLPFSPDLPPAAPTTLRAAVTSWHGLAGGERDRALLFVTPGDAGREVLGAGEIAHLARRFDLA